MIGYFPASLFPNMENAHQVGWGGRTSTTQGGPSPKMGSGYFPDGIFTHSSYFINVGFQIENSQEYIGPHDYEVEEVTDNSNCFVAKYYGLQKVGYSLQFGGPGGNCG